MEPHINENDTPQFIDHSEFEHCLELEPQDSDIEVPISKLPNDVLLEIFVALRAGDDDDGRIIEKWHHVAHICQRWRHLALGAANLWTDPPTYRHGCTLAMLERSRNAPLNIMLSRNTAQTTREEILKHAGRIKCLTLNEDAKEALESSNELLANAASQLHELRVNHCPLFPHGLHHEPPYRLTLKTPATMPLRVLQLSLIDMDWQMFPIRSLTWLSLFSMRLSAPPSWAHLQQALGGMPLLQQLTFGFSDLQLTSPGPSLLEPIKMPHLQQMFISTGTASAIAYFLSSTIFLQLRRVFICCTLCIADECDALIDAVVSKADIAHLDSFSLTRDRFWLKQTVPPSQWDLRSELDFAHPLRRDGLAPMIRFARRVTADAAVHLTPRIVNLRLAANLTAEQLVELFGYSLPNLKSIQMFSVSQALVEGLVIPSTHPPDQPIPFRNLREIRLEVEGDSSLYTPELVTALFECLISRRKHQVPVTKVFLKGELTPNQVNELKGLVSQVEIRGLMESEDETE